jgi:hypothetical protein
MRVERRRRVGADDPKVLQPVVVGNAVHVVEDQRHLPALPLLTLAAQLKAPVLQACVV